MRLWAVPSRVAQVFATSPACGIRKQISGFFLSLDVLRAASQGRTSQADLRKMRCTVFWAKKDDAGIELDLSSHCLDVAKCFRELCGASGFDRALEALAGRSLSDGDLDRLTILAALHDIGKANGRFQAGQGGHLKEGIALCHPRGAFSFLWQWGTADTLSQALCATFSHHGNIVWEPEAAIMHRICQNLEETIPPAGFEWIAEFGEDLVSRFPAAMAAPDLPESPAFWHLFAGLLTLADQVGSGTEFFPIDRPSDLEVDARGAIRAKGLDTRWKFSPRPVSEAEAFGWPEGSLPSPMQQALAHLPLNDRLVLLESETGSGKTEAALMRFKALAAAEKVSGLYFAIPTRSSAVQIQRRVNSAAQKLWGMEAGLAVPGYLTFGGATGRRISPFDVSWSDTGAVMYDRWAMDAPRKYLAAPIAVGTVDQALAAALKRKWAHMRGGALARSLLVIDEVHASDAYMTTIMTRLVKDHLDLGGHVLLMSATLSTERRHQIFEACGATPERERTVAPYPALTSLRGSEQIVTPIAPTGTGKTVHLFREATINDAAEFAKNVIAAAREGGRVLVIRNSVRGARDLFNAILSEDPDAPLLDLGGIMTCHHSRYAAIDRKALDKAVEDALGKKSTGPVIVIGTQTLEQSLDIDADYLFTDVCPIDVLLQRIGRLHRHIRTDRPDAFAVPVVIVQSAAHLTEKERRQNGIGYDRAYPDRFMVDAVEEMIRDIPEWCIPEDNRYLVDRGACDALLDEEAGRSAKGRMLSMKRLARNALLDRTRPIYEQDDFSSLNGSRLGDHPVIVEFTRAVPSPFGVGTFKQLQIPYWMIGDSATGVSEIKVKPEVNPDTGVIRFTCLGRVFDYDRTGLQAAGSAPE